MTNTEKRDRCGKTRWYDGKLRGMQRILVRTNTGKVRTNMERVRLGQEDWAKTLVAESLTNETCFVPAFRY